MRRLLVVVTIVMVALFAAPSVEAVTSSVPRSYSFTVERYQPHVKYYDGFTYEWVKVSGSGAPGVRTSIHRFISKFVGRFLRPAAADLPGLKRNAPWWFQHRVQLVPRCRSDYVCVEQDIMFGNKGIAGSVTGVRAKAWSLRTGHAAELSSFVAPGDLPEFLDRAKAAIRHSYCFYGFHIDLSADYNSFPDWVPVDGGIRLWYPEYKFGCAITDATVAWK